MDRAQAALPPGRRRHLAAWSTVREFIEPYMPAAAPESADGLHGAADAQTDDEADATGFDADAASLQLPLQALIPDGTPTDSGVAGSSSAASQAIHSDTAASTSPTGASETAGAEPPDAIEAALLRALSSPRVLEKLTSVFASAMGRALGQFQADPATAASLPKAGPSPAPTPIASPRPKVLIAGISPADAHHLAEAMRNKLDLRFWRQGDSREQLRLHGRACSVAVVMSEAVDSDVEALLRSMQLRVVRHTYNAARLEERLNEMQDHGMFNLLI